MGRLVFLGIIFLVAACDAKDGATEWRVAENLSSYPPCEIGASELARMEGGVVLGQDEYPCEALALPARIVLVGTAEAVYPDPALPVEILASGNVISGSSGRGVLVEWRPDGSYITSYDRPGQGPGEIDAIGDLLLVPAGGDSVYVIDGRNRWSLFGPHLTFVRSFATVEAGRDSRYIHVTSNGEILSTNGSPFRVIDEEGTVRRTFGEQGNPGERQDQSMARASAYGGDSTFWVAPPDGANGGIVLEQWSLNGHRIQRLQRDVSWLPEEGYPANSAGGMEPPLPQFAFLNVDQHGLLWYFVIVRDRRWKRPEERHSHEEPELNREDRLAELRQLYDLRMEVIDPTSATVVASVMFDDPRPPFDTMLKGSRTFTRMRADSLGIPIVELFEVELIQRRPR